MYCAYDHPNIKPDEVQSAVAVYIDEDNIAYPMCPIHTVGAYKHGDREKIRVFKRGARSK